MKIQDTQSGASALAGFDQSKSMELMRAAQRASAGAAAGAPTEEESEVATSFETYFATMLVKEMRKSLPEGLFSGAGSDVYSSWFDEHVGASLADRDALGLAGMVRTALSRTPANAEAQGAAAADGDDSPHEPSQRLGGKDR